MGQLAGNQKHKKAFILSAFLLAALFPGARAEINCLPERIDASYQVAHVYDGDTVRLRNGDKVRFIGINTPELGRDGKPSEAFARKAKNRLVQLLKAQNHTLNLRYGNEPRDRYRRLLAHAYLPDNRSIAAILLREGLATRITIPPNVRDADCYRQAEWAARTAQRGLWSLPTSHGVDVNQLSDKTKGFGIIKGKLSRIQRQRGMLCLNLQERIRLCIDHHDQKYFDTAFLQGLTGQRIHVRGWINPHKNTLQMRLRHPAAIEVE